MMNSGPLRPRTRFLNGAIRALLLGNPVGSLNRGIPPPACPGHDDPVRESPNEANPGAVPCCAAQHRRTKPIPGPCHVAARNIAERSQPQGRARLRRATSPNEANPGAVPCCTMQNRRTKPIPGPCQVAPRNIAERSQPRARAMLRRATSPNEANPGTVPCCTMQNRRTNRHVLLDARMQAKGKVGRPAVILPVDSMSHPAGPVPGCAAQHREIAPISAPFGMGARLVRSIPVGIGEEYRDSPLAPHSPWYANRTARITSKCGRNRSIT